MNYQALGEHTAYTAQAKAAAGNRFARLKNLAYDLERAGEYPAEPFEPEKLRKKFEEAVACDREMHAALARANEAAALCGEPELQLMYLRNS